MNIAAVRRWKMKERKFNQKYKLNIVKKATHSRDLKGKFVFLLSKTNLCAVLKYLSKNVCITETLLKVDEKFINQISPKFIIPHKKHKKLLAQSEVRITENFRICCEKYYKKSKWVTEKIVNPPIEQNTSINNELIISNKPDPASSIENRKITPIKILSCNICDQKFLKRELLENHMKNTHFNGEDSSGSEKELTIDDDVELLVDIDNLSTTSSSVKTVKSKKGRKMPVKTGRNFKCLQCSAQCGTEESLLNHIERTHPCSSSTSPRNCVGYDFDKYPVSKKVNDSIDKRRSLSSNSSFSSISKQSSIETPEKMESIKFRRYDSITKDSFICKICSASFIQRQWLNRHITTTHLSIVYKCFKCNVPFNKKLHLVRHLKTAHLRYSNEDGYIETLEGPDSFGYFQCCFCKYSSKVREKVSEHMINEHYEDFEKSELQDESISSSPDSLEELLLPETRALNNSNEMDEDELLTELLPKDHSSNSNKLRKAPNDPSFRYRCGRCLKRFSRSSWLKRHPCIVPNINIKKEPTDSPKKPKMSYEVNGFLKCRNKLCSQVFTDRSLYEHHIKTAH